MATIVKITNQGQPSAVQDSVEQVVAKLNGSDRWIVLTSQDGSKYAAERDKVTAVYESKD